MVQEVIYVSLFLSGSTPMSNEILSIYALPNLGVLINLPLINKYKISVEAAFSSGIESIE